MTVVRRVRRSWSRGFSRAKEIWNPKVWNFNPAFESGFTLLELLVSMTIVGLVLTGVYTALQMGTRSWKRGIENTELLYNARFVLDALSGELRATYFKADNPSFAFLGTDLSGDEEGVDADSLEFVTASQPAGEKGLGTYDLRRVGYYLDESGLGLIAMIEPIPYRFDPESSSPGSEVPLLMTGESRVFSSPVASVNLRYFDGSEWVDGWDSRVSGSVPEAVEITVKIRGSNRPFVTEVAIPVAGSLDNKKGAGEEEAIP